MKLLMKLNLRETCRWRPRAYRNKQSSDALFTEQREFRYNSNGRTYGIEPILRSACSYVFSLILIDVDAGAAYLYSEAQTKIRIFMKAYLL